MAEQDVIVNGQPGVYVHGSWEAGSVDDPNAKQGGIYWDDNADDAYLTWEQNGVTYLLTAYHLGLKLEDLLKIAASLR